jgi:hypothetical protein
VKFFLLKLQECDEAIGEARKEARLSPYEIWLQGYRCAVLDCMAFFDPDTHEELIHTAPGSMEIH